MLRSRVSCAPGKPALFVSRASIVGNTILKGHMHRYEWSRDIDSGTAATRKAPLVNAGVETHYFLGKGGSYIL